MMLLLLQAARAQLRGSFVTSVGVLRNFSPHQQFTSIGQTVEGDLHITPRETFLIWINYAIPGRFKNQFQAPALDMSTMPVTTPYTVKGTWNLREFSLGWKHYFKGNFMQETGWNLFGTAGLGILVASVKNTYVTKLDTVLYKALWKPEIGAHHFRKLTADLAIGMEIPIGGDFSVTGDLRVMLPASSTATNYTHYDEKVPLTVFANLGIRILFGSSE